MLSQRDAFPVCLPCLSGEDYNNDDDDAFSETCITQPYGSTFNCLLFIILICYESMKKFVSQGLRKRRGSPRKKVAVPGEQQARTRQLESIRDQVLGSLEASR